MPENVRKRWLSMNTYGKPITRTTVKCYIEGSLKKKMPRLKQKTRRAVLVTYFHFSAIHVNVL